MYTKGVTKKILGGFVGEKEIRIECVERACMAGDVCSSIGIWTI